MPFQMDVGTQYWQGYERGVRTGEEARELARKLKRTKPGARQLRAFQLGAARRARKLEGIGG
jgi:hypothetical protein